jgi:hypothetical protein
VQDIEKKKEKRKNLERQALEERRAKARREGSLRKTPLMKTMVMTTVTRIPRGWLPALIGSCKVYHRPTSLRRVRGFERAAKWRP